MSQPPSTTQRRLNVSDALGFLDAVKAKFRDVPQFYDRFLNTMSDFRAERIDTLGTVEAVIDLLHPFPDLLLAWNTFLPDVWHVQSAPDPKDPYTSLVTVKTPSGEMSLRKKVDDEMYPLIPIKEEMAPILALLGHVKEHYTQRRDVYRKLIQAIQPRPDEPIDKYQMIEEIAQILPDSPHLIERFKEILEIEPRSPPFE